jgi:hypothetical protein
MTDTYHTEYEWARFPADWVRKGTLRDISSTEAGLAALKIYLGLAGWFSSSSWDSSLERLAGLNPEIAVSFNHIQALTGLNRTLIVAGIGVLEELNLILLQRGRGRARHKYRLAGDMTSGFAKIPRFIFEPQRKIMGTFTEFRQTNLHQFDPSLSDGSLAGLKLYTLILAYRSKSLDNRTKISYDKLTSLTGVARNDVAANLDFLQKLGLIKIERKSEGISGPNMYFIQGLGPYKKPTYAELNYSLEEDELPLTG